MGNITTSRDVTTPQDVAVDMSTSQVPGQVQIGHWVHSSSQFLEPGMKLYSEMAYLRCRAKTIKAY